jgi:hypothetical protein
MRTHQYVSKFGQVVQDGEVDGGFASRSDQVCTGHEQGLDALDVASNHRQQQWRHSCKVFLLQNFSQYAVTGIKQQK